MTLKAVKTFLDKISVDFFTLENVDMESAGEDDASNLNMIIKALESSGPHGYHVQVYKLCTLDYGLPQRRVRLFFVGLQKSTQEASAFRNIEMWLNAFKLKTQPPEA